MSPVTGVPQGISVFVDGVRVNEPTVEEVNFDLIPLDDVERIGLIRGPSAVFGRNTLGGSLNIITKRGGDKPEVITQAEGGSFGRQKYRASLGGASGPIDYYVAGSLLREDGSRDLGAAKLDKAFGKLGYRGGDTDVTLSFQYANNRIQQPGSLPPDELREDRTRNFTGGDFFAPRLYLTTVNARQALGDETALSLNAFARKLDVEQFNASLIGDNTRGFTDTLSYGGTAQLTYEPILFGRRHHFAVGVEYTRHRVTSTVFEEKNARTLAECVGGLSPAGAISHRSASGGGQAPALRENRSPPRTNRPALPVRSFMNFLGAARGYPCQESWAASAANSAIVSVSARREGSIPANSAAVRIASAGRPSPAVSALARVFRRWANAARTTTWNRRSSASGMHGPGRTARWITAESTFGGGLKAPGGTRSARRTSQ